MAPLSLLTKLSLILSLTTPLLAFPNIPPSPSSSLRVCPTITKTTDSASCPQPTPTSRPCPSPDCIYLSSVRIPCGCPTSVATQYAYTACAKGCSGACGTQWLFETESGCTAVTSKTKTTSTSKPTTKSLTSTSKSTSSPISTYTPPVITTTIITQITTKIPTTTSPTTKITTTMKTQPASCATITATEGPECWTAGCPFTYSRCARQGSVTLSCGCSSIPTVTACLKTCDGGCWTNYATTYVPCPMTPSVSWVTRTGDVLTVPTQG